MCKSAFRWMGIACVLASTCSVAQSAKILRIESGLIAGSEGQDIDVYKGIPFAAPPIKSLRWRPPEPPLPWTDILKVNTFRPTCLQLDTPGNRQPTSEDCLYLNIWTPRNSNNSKLPVMVWFHGGSFIIGSASSPMYWGDELARKGAVVVNVAYRLGALGFMAHPELTKESKYKVSGNYALMDMLAALHWIKRNISIFNGDPDCVTIFGESMGARAVNLLMVSPMARGLFHRAIGQSGAFFAPAGTPHGIVYLKAAESDGQAFATKLSVDSIAALRELEPQKFINQQHSFLPVIDGYFIPNEVHEIFAGGLQNDVPTLIGYNDNEGINLVNKRLSAAGFKAQIRRGSSTRQFAEEALAIYPVMTEEQAWRSQLNLKRDVTFGWDMWTWARMQAQTGNTKVFLYYFSHSPPYPLDGLSAGWGAAHGAEMFYTFKHLAQYDDWSWTADDWKLSETMSSYWVNFARTGDPNADGLPVWPPFTLKLQTTMYFKGTAAQGRLPNQRAMEFLEREAQRMRMRDRGSEDRSR